MQCAAIPYRRTHAGELEVLLVTSRGKGNWILPKGKVKPGKSAAGSLRKRSTKKLVQKAPLISRSLSSVISLCLIAMQTPAAKGADFFVGSQKSGADLARDVSTKTALGKPCASC
jgi:hypothetical protein